MEQIGVDNIRSLSDSSFHLYFTYTKKDPLCAFKFFELEQYGGKYLKLSGQFTSSLKFRIGIISKPIAETIEPFTDMKSQIYNKYELNSNIPVLFDEFLELEPVYQVLTILHPFIASLGLKGDKFEVVFQHMPGAKNTLRRIISFIMTAFIHFSFQTDLV